MCGITGFADFKENISERYNTLRTMTSKLLKRGPDDTGFWTEENVMLGHRRLIVVDPDGGKQPMFKKQGEREYILVYNGELYNTEDIRICMSKLTENGEINFADSFSRLCQKRGASDDEEKKALAYKFGYKNYDLE
jgi:asparagine synthetase B (glutamine-hydrolysing)